MFCFLVCAFCASAVHAATLRVQRFVPSEDPHRFDTEMDNAYASETVEVSPNSTALVIIDVWNDAYNPVLAENEEKRILPLLAAARQLGFFIIHAPSEGSEWRNISVLPGEVLVKGEDGRPGSASRCDGHLQRAGIKHVLIAGYDTNYCMVDKPCGIVSLSMQLEGQSEIILLRDITRPEPKWYHNLWFSYMMGSNMLEAGPWLPTRRQFIRSTELSDLVDAFHLNLTVDTLKYPQPDANQTFRAPGHWPVDGHGNRSYPHTALVVVSCSVDWANDGFRAKVRENINDELGPLLMAARKSKAVTIIHVLNAHIPAPQCTPLAGEFVANTTLQFDSYLQARSIDTLLYAGYAANRDMLFGVAGMQRYYSDHRYLGKKVPDYFWIEEATVGLEIAESLEGNWGKKVALAYRQPLITSAGNILSSADVKKWLCSTGPILVSNGLFPPSTHGSGLIESEYSALTDIWNNCGGSRWAYRSGTDAVSGGNPWMVGDPCMNSWFGVKCDDEGKHVVMLFPNPRDSGNPLHCQLPSSIGNFTYLEHLYTSNDASPSSLYGGVPETVGRLLHLKCMYFSHNNLTLPLPKSLELLTELQVFLIRKNHISGSLIDFTKLPKLRNVWLDGNELTGTLDSLGSLSQLTYLEAANNRFTGDIPKKLCGIQCLAGGNNVSCSEQLPRGCCDIPACGKAAPAPAPVKPSMGECFPQLPLQFSFI